ncbi:dTDP-glucose 4,6-dehydratase [Candidatus Nitrosotalea okcheonensis]|nr:dTDP-glucose 4,6-dehydratase [Candidatus Nitrosotalea okcheonensis]
MDLLICGGAGFIGSAFIRNHLKNNPKDKIMNLDSLTIGSNKDNLKEIEQNPNYTFIKDDIRNFETVSKFSQMSDIIINFAAETHVDRSIANPKPFIDTNIVGTYTLLEAARKYDKLFFHISTDEIYGDAETNISSSEEDPIKPSNPYSATKASSDMLVGAYYRTYGMKCITTRCTNNFGPYQFPEKLIPKTIIRATRNLKIPLYDGGYQIRSWIYVLDHVEAIESLIKNGKSGEVYNITAWNEITNKTVVENILKLLNKPLDLIDTVGDRPGHDKRYSINASKIQRTTGWKPKYEFDQALRETVSWYENNVKWWESLANEKTLHPQPWTIS